MCLTVSGAHRLAASSIVLDQVDAAARRCRLIGEQDIGRAGRVQKPQWTAGARIFSNPERRIGELGEGDSCLHRRPVA